MSRMPLPFWHYATACFGGLVAGILVMLVLFPLMDMVMDRYFHLFSGNTYPASHRDRVRIGFMAWIAAGTFTAAYTAARIARSRKMACGAGLVVALGLGWSLTSYFLDGTPSNKDIRELSPVALSSLLFAVAGAMMAVVLPRKQMRTGIAAA